VSAKWAKGTGGPAGDEVQNMVAHALTGEGFDASEDGTGRGVPLVPVLAIQERAVAENPNAGPDGVGIQDGVAYTLEARQQVQAVAFAENQRNEIREMHVSGALAGIRRGDAKNETLLAISFSCKDHGGDVTDDLAPTLRAMGHRESHANSGGQLAVAFDMRGRAGGAQFEGPHDTTSLRAAEGGSSRSYVATRWAVRRLTPRECERLQGFPDDYTAISWRGRPAEACPDGPRYKALGNAMAVPVMRWIGTRLAAAMPERAAP
jgi:DNA (cytosine-5)-methyltransferase 1